MTTTITAEQYRKQALKQRKYNNRIVKTDEGKFDSAWEYQCWCALKRREMAGEVANLERQVSYELHGADGSVVCKIIPDFQWNEMPGGEKRVADAKGMAATKDWKLKAKMFAAEYGIEIEEMRRG